MPRGHWKLVASQRRLGGQCERRVVKGEKESTEIPVRILAVIFRIPSMSLDFWRVKLRTCLSMCVDCHGIHLQNGAKMKPKKQVWALVANLLSYDRNGAWPTGRWDRVNLMAYYMSLEVFGALRPLWLVTTEKKKARGFRTRVWQHLPIPFQTFLTEEHPEICEHFEKVPTADAHELYRVTGDQMGPDRSEDQTDKPVRVWAFKQPLWVAARALETLETV